MYLPSVAWCINGHIRVCCKMCEAYARISNSKQNDHPLVLRLRMSAAVPPLPHIHSSAHRDNFTLCVQ